MIWSKLNLLIILYLVVWVFISSFTMKMLQIRSFKKDQIVTLQTKQKISNPSSYDEKSTLKEIKNMYWFQLYQLIDRNAIYDKFINSTIYRYQPKWMIYQGWTIWENKILTNVLDPIEYDHVYFAYIHQKMINLVKIK